MPQLIVALFIIIAILGALQFLVPAFLLAAFTMACGCVFAAAACLLYVLSEIDRAIAGGDADLKLQLDDGTREFSFDVETGRFWSELDLRFRWLFVIAAAFGVIASVAILARSGTLAGLRAFDTPVQVTTTVGWMLFFSAAMGVVCGALNMDRTRPAISGISRWKLRGANNMLGGANGIFEQLQECRRLSSELQIQDPVASSGLLAKFQALPLRKTELAGLENSTCEVKREVAKINCELEQAHQEMQHFEQKYILALQAANTASNLSVFDCLTEMKRTGLAFKAYLEQGKWAEFHDSYAALTEELEQLIAKPGAYGEPDSGATSASPFGVLGVKEDITEAELTGLYRRLKSLYHPDKGLVQDGSKFVEIDAAYKAILRQLRARS